MIKEIVKLEFFYRDSDLEMKQMNAANLRKKLIKLNKKN